MRRLRLAIGVVAICTATVVVASSAFANAPVSQFSITPSTTQAGAHPDLVTDLDLVNQSQLPATQCRCNILKEFTVSSPPGLVGSPMNTPRCTQAQFGSFNCPTDSQIGVTIDSIGTKPEDNGQYWFQPLYNMVPRPDELALWATYTPFIALPSIFTSISTRTDSDYGLDLRTVGIPMLGTPPEITIITWGVPADPVHDELRWPPGLSTSWEYTIGCFQELGSPLPEIFENKFPSVKCPGQKTWPSLPANFEPVPYLSNPTTCSGPMTTTIETVAYDLETFRRQAPYPETTGCDQLSFDPSLSGKPTTKASDSPSGMDIDLRVPQTLSPSTTSPSQIRASTIKLPEGFTINPNAADGKTACTDAEARFGTRQQAQCPEYAKIGTLEIESAGLPRVLPGALYIGQPLPGNRYRVFLVADGFSVHIKLPGVATPDPETGQLTLSFNELPQTPFERFGLHIFGAERGLLATPTRCGTYPVESEFVPWASELPVQKATQFFEIDSGPSGAPCPGDTRPFSPWLNVGITDSTAAHHSTLVFDLRRSDGDQNLTAADVSMPPGFTASLAGIPYCPDSSLIALAQSSYLGVTELNAPICAASRVGSSVAAAGAGSRPVSLPGNVYLAGPYRGAPLSLAVVTPAVTGPYDLGNVPVRIPIKVDPVTVQISAASDPFPSIIDGIPTRLRRLVLTLDRPGFVRNPTSCRPHSVQTRVFGDQGASSDISTPFQVANCGALDFAPSFNIRLRGSASRRGHPAIRAELRANPGDADIRKVRVTLPKGELLDSSHIRTVCTRAQFAAEACPPESEIGTAEAASPLLDRPLVGSVYLRSSANKLPDMVIDLRGQINVELSGRVDSVAGRLRTDFETVPDVPVSRFVLNLQGGKKGLLVNSNDLCSKTKRAKVMMVAHSERQHEVGTPIKASCAKGSRKSRKRAER